MSSRKVSIAFLRRRTAAARTISQTIVYKRAKGENWKATPNSSSNSSSSPQRLYPEPRSRKKTQKMRRNTQIQAHVRLPLQQPRTATPARAATRALLEQGRSGVHIPSFRFESWSGNSSLTFTSTKRKGFNFPEC